MNLAIIGGGPAGLSAAIRARELGLTDVWVVERANILGGILNQCIHHGFGVHIFKEELTGPEYAEHLISQAKELGVNFLMETMVVDIRNDRTITYINEFERVEVKPKAIILTMGCRERPRGAIGIPGDRGVGVYTAGLAQAVVNMKGYLVGKKVVILGSGDIGLIMARRMTLEGAKVLGVYEIAPYPGGLKRNIAQCLDDYNIPLFLSHTVSRIVGKNRLEGVYISKVNEDYEVIDGTEQFIKCDTLLLSVGLIPENELASKMGVKLSKITGGAIVNSSLETNIPGVFASGNVLHVHDLVDYVTNESFNAAESAVKFIKGELVKGEEIPVVFGGGVRYTVPMSLVYEKDEDFFISLRSDKIYKNVRVKIFADDKLIKSVKKRIVLPSEMERIKFKLEDFASEIKVCIKEG